MEKQILNTKTSLALNGVVSSSAEFEAAFKLFTDFRPVKIAKHLKAEFYKYISDKLIENNTWFWSGECKPLVNSYKFRRTA